MKYAQRLALLLPLAGLVACAAEPDSASPSRLPREAPSFTAAVLTAHREKAPATLEASASLVALRRVSPGSKILGRVDRLAVREGDAVKAGALLARLESRDLEAAVIQAKAAVTMAEAQLENAAAMARRMRELEGRGSATVKNREDAVAGERIAAAAVEQARANLEASKVTLSYAEVRSPVAGWVVRKMAEAGDMAIPGQPLFVIEDLSELEARAEIPESSVAGLAPGAPAKVTVDALGRTYATTLDRLIPAGDAGSRSFEARFRLPNGDQALKSGLFARVAMPLAAGREALLIPASAVRQRGQLQSVLVVKEGRAGLRFVKAGNHDGQRIEILSGLEEGESFLADPPPGVIDGSPIQAQGGGGR